MKWFQQILEFFTSFEKGRKKTNGLQKSFKKAYNAIEQLARVKKFYLGLLFLNLSANHLGLDGDLLLRKPVAFAQIPSHHPDKIFACLAFAFFRVAPAWSRWAKPPSQSSPLGHQPLQTGKGVIENVKKKGLGRGGGSCWGGIFLLGSQLVTFWVSELFTSSPTCKE